ncbi:hypothetical protein T439DRAFT_325880, partial [Meredithblackwellia eburnea MCA 4105]
MVVPLGPQWEKDRWWFQGTNYTDSSVLPSPANATVLPAGGTVTFEIACHGDHTNMSTQPSLISQPGSQLDACPSGAGPYHSHTDTEPLAESSLGGCALGIVDTTNVADVTMSNMVIFTVQPKCVWQKETSFEIPSAMPACSGDFCICAWFWTPTQDLPNTYMTGFYCKVTKSTSTSKWGNPSRAAYCKEDTSKCTKGPKTPMYFNNIPNNTWEWDTNNPNDKRPQYGATWGWTGGPQNDIFSGGVNSASSTISSSPTVSSGSGLQSSTSSNTLSSLTLISGDLNGPGTSLTTAGTVASSSVSVTLWIAGAVGLTLTIVAIGLLIIRCSKTQSRPKHGKRPHSEENDEEEEKMLGIRSIRQERGWRKRALGVSPPSEDSSSSEADSEADSNRFKSQV